MLRYPHLARRDLAATVAPWFTGILIGGFLTITMAIGFSATVWTAAEAANLYLSLGLAGLLGIALRSWG